MKDNALTPYIPNPLDTPPWNRVGTPVGFGQELVIQTTHKPLPNVGTSCYFRIEGCDLLVSEGD
jgi:hypothetical protein